jgi:hypothetical protein
MALTPRLCIVLDLLIVTGRLRHLEPEVFMVKCVNLANHLVNLTLPILVLGDAKLLEATTTCSDESQSVHSPHVTTH